MDSVSSIYHHADDAADGGRVYDLNVKLYLKSINYKKKKTSHDSYPTATPTENLPRRRIFFFFFFVAF